jgi:hypothetical protein
MRLVASPTCPAIQSSKKSTTALGKIVIPLHTLHLPISLQNGKLLFDAGFVIRAFAFLCATSVVLRGQPATLEVSPNSARPERKLHLTCHHFTIRLNTPLTKGPSRIYV